MKLLITLRSAPNVKTRQPHTHIVADKVTFDTGSIDWERDAYEGWDGQKTGLYAPHPAGGGRIRYEDVKTISVFDAYPSLN